MALIQSLHSSLIPGNFGELVQVVFKRMLQIGVQFNATRLDLVGDRYDTVSIKGLERSRRHQTTQTYNIARPDQKLPVQWKQFLSSGANKQSLQAFISAEFYKCHSSTDITVVTALQREVTKLQFRPQFPTTVTRCVDLDSDHEEADTRLLLHANDCSANHETVVIWSPDTDVAVIALGNITSISCELLFATGTGKHQRLLSLTDIAVTLGPMAEALPAFHALTGCDTTSSFYGKGKKSALNTIMARPDLVIALKLVGTEFTIEDIPTGIEETVCAIYNAKASTVNTARFELFKTGSAEKAMPPNKDALKQHIRRVNYQTKIWKSALCPMMNCPGPQGNGWVLDADDNLSIIWLEGDYAPQSILKTQKCRCATTACKGGRCKCLKEGLRCTALCACINCENQTDPLESDGEADSDAEIEGL